MNSHKTPWGEIITGDSLEVMRGMPSDSVDLVITSPPYALNAKKEYGNTSQSGYADWFMPFALEIKRIIKDTGSFVLNIGGAWKSGLPVKSLYQYELLLELSRAGFHLAQDFYWHNPAAMTSPTQWTGKKRVRVKNSIEFVWWLSKTPFPKASNRRVMVPYSDSTRKYMNGGIKNQKSVSPSGYTKNSESLRQDNGGSIPTNLLMAANSGSAGQYFKYCKENGLMTHPARFPAELPEFFIRMVTDVSDTVVDPFAGSCMVGEVCEELRRKWKCIEIDSSYTAGALGRFMGRKKKKKNTQYYKVFKTGSCHPPESDAELKTGNEKP